jgi:hypothetical protein
MADRLLLSNDADVGYAYAEDIFSWATPLETSAHGFSAVNVPLVGPMPRNGRVVDVILGVAQPALSASGFVSGTVIGNVRINSGANICTTAPSIAMAATSATCIRKATNDVTTGVTPAVLGLASAVFSAGDMIEVDYNAVSVGSAAAGAAGNGAYIAVVVRYDAA